MLPTVHVQTAGHASGNAFYYQKSQVVDPPSTWDGMVGVIDYYNFYG